MARQYNEARKSDRPLPAQGNYQLESRGRTIHTRNSSQPVNARPGNRKIRQPDRHNQVSDSKVIRPVFKTRGSNAASPSQGNQRIDDLQQRHWYYRLHKKIRDNRYYNRDYSLLAGLPRRGRLPLLIVFLTIYLIMLISGWQLLPFNKVNSLEVRGNQVVPSALIEQASDIYSYYPVDRVYSYREEYQENIQAQLPLIENVVFERNTWDKLTIKVTEHSVVAKLATDHGIQLVLNNGELLALQQHDMSSNYNLADYPDLINFNQSGKIKELANALNGLEDFVVAQMDTITLSQDASKPSAIKIQMKDGNTITAIISTLAQKMQFYPEILQVLAGQKGVLNFEVGTYFTPYDNPNNSINLSNN